jgi:polysaccharide export outer membrane protein
MHIRLSTILLVLALTFAPDAAPAAENGYALNPGDVLEVSVWKEEGMERDVLVLPDGRISFPLAGHIQAAGRSAEQVVKILAQRLKRYFPDPVITVTVKSVGGYSIFVIGQVRQSGQFFVNQRTDVMQALSLAGGFTEFADEDDIKILRREGGKQSILPFDYSDVEKGRELESNILLRSGDVVVVPTEGLF